MTNGYAPRRSAAAHAALLLTLAAAVIGATGCRSGNRPPSEKWLKSVNSIKPGTKMDAVRDKIGRPDVKREGETPVRPYPPIGSPEKSRPRFSSCSREKTRPG